MNNKRSSIFVGIPVYNEEKTIVECLNSVYQALQKVSINYKVIICFNGTTDKSESIVKEIQKKYKNLKLINSEWGKTKAVCRIIETGKDADIGMFLDADSIMEENAIARTITAYKMNKKAVCVTGNPLPKCRNFLAQIINIRRIYYKSQIPPVAFKGYKKKRNYIHGRLFSFKKSVFKPLLESNLRFSKGDDTYISYFLINRYGRESFIEDENIHVFYTPILTIKGWWKKYTRIWSDMDNVLKLNPEFKKLERYMDCKIDWNYVFKQKWRVRIYFFLERILIKGGYIFFRVSSLFVSYGWKRIDETKI